MTQAQVAKVINCNKGTYANIESGKRDPSLKTAKRIACALRSTVDALFINTTHPNSNTDKEDVRTGKDPDIAAAELSEIPSSAMVKASKDLRDGRADTKEGRKVLELSQAVCGPAMG
jgi:DNA-binding XRE family transcriptional regulator